MVARAWILLHGTPLDPDFWSDLGPVLGRHQPVYAPDATPAIGDPHPQLAIAQRLAIELPGLAGRWDVVGHSFGGQVAIELALLEPDRVATLSLICSRDTAFPPFADAAANLRAGDPVDVEAAIARWFRPEERDSGGRLIAYAQERLIHADRRTWATALDAIATYDRTAVVHLIQAPTMLICAELDPVSGPGAMSALSDRLPDARLEIMPAAAHLSPFTNPAALADRLNRHAGRTC